MKTIFVLAAVGDHHVRTAETAIFFLKRFSRSEIVLFTARSTHLPAHDQVLEVELPDEMNDHNASIFLKTNLLTVLGNIQGEFCYLDNDVIAVKDDVDRIFDFKVGPITFAADHAQIDAFSRYAVNCRCAESQCPHLREAILCSFGIEVRQCDWTMWNGGVFLFNRESGEFLNEWHSLTRQISNEPFWSTRDQGTLAATVWKLGYATQATLPQRFNFIVDPLWGIPLQFRRCLSPEQFHVRRDYSLVGDNHGLLQPSFLHFVNNGINQRGWHNWDQVEALGKSLEEMK